MLMAREAVGLQTMGEGGAANATLLELVGE